MLSSLYAVQRRKWKIQCLHFSSWQPSTELNGEPPPLVVLSIFHSIFHSTSIPLNGCTIKERKSLLPMRSIPFCKCIWANVVCIWRALQWFIDNVKRKPKLIYINYFAFSKVDFSSCPNSFPYLHCTHSLSLSRCMRPFISIGLVPKWILFNDG